MILWALLSISSFLLLCIGWYWVEGVLRPHFRGRSFERDYLSALRGAVVNLLRTRDGVRLEIPRELVGASAPGPTGRVFLPPEHPMPDGDREHLLEMIQGRLGSDAIDGRYNMQGSAPYLELYIPQQPPGLLTWERMMEMADPSNPYIGDSATGVMRWDPSDPERPHIGVAGKTGSGKTELMAFIVAQTMRGGAGVLVIDIKGFSHEWIADIPGVHYARSPQGIHDAVLWLHWEMSRRINERVNRRQYEFPRLVVILEERNSTQEALRQLWEVIRPTGVKGRSPAIAGIDAVLSQARAVQINVIMAGQETAEQKVGSKVNYGAWAVGAKMERNHWRNVGADRKPTTNTTVRGRWGWVNGGQVTMFQAVYPDLANHTARLRIWAIQGEERYDVIEAMRQVDSVTTPWSEAVSSDPDPTPVTDAQATLSEFAAGDMALLKAMRNARHRADFPETAGARGNAALYLLTDLQEWLDGRTS